MDFYLLVILSCLLVAGTAHEKRSSASPPNNFLDAFYAQWTCNEKDELLNEYEMTSLIFKETLKIFINMTEGNKLSDCYTNDVTSSTSNGPQVMYLYTSRNHMCNNTQHILTTFNNSVSCLLHHPTRITSTAFVATAVCANIYDKIDLSPAITSVTCLGDDGWEVHEGIGLDCWEDRKYKYEKLQPYPVDNQPHTLANCKDKCAQHSQCQAIMMPRAEIENGESTTCYMIKKINNIFSECTWGHTDTYNVYEKKGSNCPFGYTPKSGDVPGWGSLEGKIQVKSRLECARLCNQKQKCLSFEHSDTSKICNLNKERNPTSENYKDQQYCSKQDYLPKNGNWNLLFRQTINGKDGFFKENEWTRNKENVDAPNYSILGDFEKFRKPDGSFHLFLWYPELGMGNEWVQTSNPVTKTSGGVDNYKAIMTPYTGNYWGGLEHNNVGALLDGSVHELPNYWWWYAIGSTTDYNGGIPGPKDDKEHVVKKVELYIDYQGCPAGWTNLTTGCYKLTNVGTHQQAIDDCKKDGGYLVEIDSWEENNALSPYYKNVNAWLGATDIEKEGEWVWSHSGRKVSFTNWQGREPNGRTRENCLQFSNYPNGSWNDAACGEKTKGVCELDTEI